MDINRSHRQRFTIHDNTNELGASILSIPLPTAIIPQIPNIPPLSNGSHTHNDIKMNVHSLPTTTANNKHGNINNSKYIDAKLFNRNIRYKSAIEIYWNQQHLMYIFIILMHMTYTQQTIRPSIIEEHHNKIECYCYFHLIVSNQKQYIGANTLLDGYKTQYSNNGYNNNGYNHNTYNDVKYDDTVQIYAYKTNTFGVDMKHAVKMYGPSKYYDFKQEYGLSMTQFKYNMLKSINIISTFQGSKLLKHAIQII